MCCYRVTCASNDIPRTRGKLQPQVFFWVFLKMTSLENSDSED